MGVGVKLSGTKSSAKTLGRKRRHGRVRKKVAGSPQRPRLVVTRSSTPYQCNAVRENGDFCC